MYSKVYFIFVAAGLPQRFRVCHKIELVQLQEVQSERIRALRKSVKRQFELDRAQ
jgi:hypothetical protein